MNIKVLSIVGCISLCHCHSAQESSNVAPATTETVATVSAVVVRTVSLPDTLQLTGSLEANVQAKVAAGIGGKVAQTFAERGQEVAKGAKLIALEPEAANLGLAEAQAHLARSKAQYALAQSQKQRSVSLKSSGTISQEEFDRFDAEFQIAEKALAAAQSKAQLAAKVAEDQTIKAPFAGHISTRLVNLGEYVTPGTPVVELVQRHPLKILVAIPEHTVPQVKTSQPLTFSVAAFEDRVFEAQVTRISPAARAATRDVLIEGTVPNADYQLTPGMFAKVAFEIGSKVLPCVPKNALRQNPFGSVLYVINQGRLEERVVELEREYQGCVAIIKGVQEGEQVVSPINNTLQDGQLVTTTEG